MIHYKQMEKADRDNMHALRAEDECRQLLVQFPNSKFAPRASQLLRNIQEALAEGEMRVGDFYFKKQSWASSSNRMQTLTDQYPLFSRADEALFKLGDAYTKMGPRFKDRSGRAYAKLVREYPLSAYADDAKKRLREMEMVAPEPDPAAVARMKYEAENRTKAGILAPVGNILKRGPDVKNAAKSGSPAMTAARPTIPVNVPVPAAATAGTTDVTVSTVGDSTTLDKTPDARLNQQQQQPEAAAAGQAAAAPAAQTPAAPAADANEPIVSKGTMPNPKKVKKPKEPKPAKKKKN